jgi:hypothetical protein
MAAWRVTATDAYPRTGPELLVHVLNCQSAYRALTPAQRRRLLNPGAPAHPRVLAALRAHGLVNDAGEYTDAGREIAAWNPPPPLKETA